MSLSKRFTEELDRAFPNLPSQCREEILLKADHPGSVGFDRSLSIQHRVALAVSAHARHAHSDYDALLQHAPRIPVAREIARKRALGQVRDAVASWTRKRHRIL